MLVNLLCSDVPVPIPLTFLYIFYMPPINNSFYTGSFINKSSPNNSLHGIPDYCRVHLSIIVFLYVSFHSCSYFFVCLLFNIPTSSLHTVRLFLLFIFHLWLCVRRFLPFWVVWLIVGSLASSLYSSSPLDKLLLLTPPCSRRHIPSS